MLCFKKIGWTSYLNLKNLWGTLSSCMCGVFIQLSDIDQYTAIICNNELSLSWPVCLLTDSEVFILYAESSQILLKIYLILILLTFMYLKYGFCNKVISERWTSKQLNTFTTYLSSILGVIPIVFWKKCSTGQRCIFPRWLLTKSILSIHMYIFFREISRTSVLTL